MGAPLTPTPRDPAPGDPKTPLVWGKGVPGPRRETRGWCCRVEGKKCLSVEVLAVGCAELCQTILVVLGCAELCHTGSARLCQTTQLCQTVPDCAKLCYAWWCWAVPNHPTGARLCQAVPVVPGCATAVVPGCANTALVVLGCAKPCHISRARLCQTIPVVPGCAKPFRASGAGLHQAVLHQQ